MDVLEGFDGLRHLPPGEIVSIGNFDGIHRGHERLLKVCEALRAASAPASGITVVTFEPHPLTVLRPDHAPPRLTPPVFKQQLLESHGVSRLVQLPPSREVLGLTAEQFWQIIRDQVRPAHLVEGASFNFGKDRGGTIQTLRQWAASSGVKLHVVDAVTAVLLNLAVVPVSSSLVRWLLTEGRARDAAICLGRPYSLEGCVVEGAKRGRTIGIPTANLRVTDQLVPADGVYAGRCMINGRSYAAAISIGTVPTFDGSDRQIEAHFPGFDGNLYGRTLRLEFLDWVREQRKFAGIASLKTKIENDLVEIHSRQIADPTREIGVA